MMELYICFLIIGYSFCILMRTNAIKSKVDQILNKLDAQTSAKNPATSKDSRDGTES